MDNTKAHFEAVVESLPLERSSGWPWPIAATEGFIRLHGKTTEPEIGSVVALLVAYNGIEHSNIPSELLFRIIDSETLVLPGGLCAVVPNVKAIFPSCCCGLEVWREWKTSLSSRVSPWLGHDPSPYVEYGEDVIRIWSDGGLGEGGSRYSIDFTDSTLREALHEVHLDLIEFLELLRDWAKAIDKNDSERLVKRFDRAFSITDSL